MPTTPVSTRDTVIATYSGQPSAKKLSPPDFDALLLAGETVAQAQLEQRQGQPAKAVATIANASHDPNDAGSAMSFDDGLALILARQELSTNTCVTGLPGLIARSMRGLSPFEGIQLLSQVVSDVSADPQLVTEIVAASAVTLRADLDAQSSAGKDQAAQAFALTAKIYCALKEAALSGAPGTSGANEWAQKLAKWSFDSAMITNGLSLLEPGYQMAVEHQGVTGQNLPQFTTTLGLMGAGSFSARRAEAAASDQSSERRSADPAPVADAPGGERSHGGDYDNPELVSGYWRPSYSDDGVRWALRGVQHDSTILELGAGDGTLTKTLAALASDAHILTSDVSPNMALRCKENVAPYASVAVITAKAQEIPLPSGQADIVIAAQSFHFFPPEAAAEIRRVTAPGGRMVVIWHIADRSVPWVDKLWDIFGNRLNGANMAEMRSRMLGYFPHEQMVLFENPKHLTPDEMVALSHTGDRWVNGDSDQRAASDAAVRQVYEDFPEALTTPLPYHTAVWVFSDTALPAPSSPSQVASAQAWQAMSAYTFPNPDPAAEPFFAAIR